MAGDKSVDAKDAENGKKGRKETQGVEKAETRRPRQQAGTRIESGLFTP
jgi:hypothetical protein